MLNFIGQHHNSWILLCIY